MRAPAATLLRSVASLLSLPACLNGQLAASAPDTLFPALYFPSACPCPLLPTFCGQLVASGTSSLPFVLCAPASSLLPSVVHCAAPVALPHALCFPSACPYPLTLVLSGQLAAPAQSSLTSVVCVLPLSPCALPCVLGVFAPPHFHLPPCPPCSSSVSL